MDIDQVLPRVFVGVCPQTYSDVDHLHDSGITAVVNVQTAGDLAYWDIDWDHMLSHYQDRGIEVRRVPVEDFNPEELRQKLPECVAALNDLLQDGHTVYVHCNVGVNRSPSTVVAYLHWMEEQSLQDALDHVRACRSCDPYVEAIELATEDRAGRAGDG
jgi:atypical dual specificity phosphatase